MHSYKQLSVISQRYIIEELKQGNSTRGGWTIDTQKLSSGFTFYNKCTKERTYRTNEMILNWYRSRKPTNGYLNYKYILPVVWEKI